MLTKSNVAPMRLKPAAARPRPDSKSAPVLEDWNSFSDRLSQVLAKRLLSIQVVMESDSNKSLTEPRISFTLAPVWTRVLVRWARIKGKASFSVLSLGGVSMASLICHNANKIVMMPVAFFAVVNGLNTSLSRLDCL